MSAITTTKRALVPVSTGIDPDLIDSLLCAAFEGGITYWADEVRVVGEHPEGAEWASDVLTRGGTLEVVEEDGTHVLTLDKMVRGLVLWGHLAHGAVPVRLETEDGEPTGFLGVVDADVADAVVQLALFGEIVYG